MSFKTLFRIFDALANKSAQVKAMFKDGLTPPPLEAPRRNPADFLGVGATDAPSVPPQLKSRPASTPKAGA